MELKLLMVVILYVYTVDGGSLRQTRANGNDPFASTGQNIADMFAALESSISSQHNYTLSIIQAGHDVLLQQIDDHFDAHETAMAASLADIADKQTALESSISSQHNDTLSIIQAEHDAMLQQIDDRLDAHETSMTAGLADIEDKQTALESSISSINNNTLSIIYLLNTIQAQHDALSMQIDDLLDTKDATYKDCTEIRNAGNTNTVSGVYTIYPTGFESTGVVVLCDMTTDNGGWTVFQRRESATDFYKNWIAYEDGFGLIGEAGNFWLGNSKVHAITSQGTYELRIDLKGDFNARLEHRAAIYQNFKLGDAASKYTLNVGAFSYDPAYNSPGDSLSGHHNGHSFSTYDNDNDMADNFNCVSFSGGAWWHNRCSSSTLNGIWGSANYWASFTATSLSFTQMMMRRTGP